MRSFGLAVLLFLLPGTTLAQSFQGLPGSGGELSVSVTPQYPRPYETATVSVLSSAIDLSSATMQVTVNGTLLYSGNVAPVGVPLKGAGATQEVTIRIDSRGTTAQRTIEIQPQDVVLVPEPLAVLPPLYPGKSFIPVSGSVRVVALAELRTLGGTRVDPTKASYKWSVGGALRASASGVGKRTLLVSAPLRYRSAEVSVVVTSPDGTLVGGDTLELASHEPLVRIYEHDPLLGIRFDQALARSYAIRGGESTLFAAPFSFPTQQAVRYEWFVNGSSVHTGNLVTLRPSGEGAGSSSLSLVVSSGDAARATTNLTLSFEALSNFFGL